MRRRVARAAAAAMLAVLAAGPVVPASAQEPPPPQQGDASGAVPPGPPHLRFRDRFAQANTTHDGRLTLAQAEAAGMRGLVRQFGAIDSAGRGYVTLAEIRAWHRARKAARGAAPPPQDAPDVPPGAPQSEAPPP